MFTSKLASIAGLIGAAVIAAVGPGFATAAFAGAPDDQITIQVSVGDLNLSSEAGAQAALARIHHAAQAICGDDGNRWPGYIASISGSRLGKRGDRNR